MEVAAYKTVIAMKDFIDNVLIKLKRKYSKDELVAHLFRTKKELELELGKVRSERDEALYELDRIKNLTQKEKSVLGAREHYKKMKAEILALKKENKKLTLENSNLFLKVVRSNQQK